MEPEQLAATDKTPEHTQGPVSSADPPGSMAWMESVLIERLSTSAQPSQMLNQLYHAQTRSARYAHLLQKMQVRSPKISRLIRKTLRETFETDPDSLLLNVPLVPDAPPWRRNLTDTVMHLLAERACTRAGAWSEQVCRPEGQAGRVLDEIFDVDLLERIEAAVPAYWQVLAENEVCSRKDRWCTLYRKFAADQAVLAHGLNQLSDAGLAMVMTLVEAPTPQARARAGGVRAKLQVAQVVCPGKADSQIPLSGALHLFYQEEAEDKRQVLYLPGLAQAFYEFSSLQEWQAQFAILVNTHALLLWPLLALPRRHQLAPATAVALQPFAAGRIGPHISMDALAHSAEALLKVQWDNELATLLEINIPYLFAGNAIKGAHMRPLERLLQVEQERGVISVQPELNTVLSRLLERDKQRRHREISFSSLSTHLPLRACEAKVRHQELAFQRLLNPQAPGEQTQAFNTAVALHKQWLEKRNQCAQLLQAQAHRLHESAFWADIGTGQVSLEQRLLNARGAALELEALLGHRMGLIDPTLLARVTALTAKAVQTSDTCADRVLAISIGSASQPRYRLRGACILAGADEPAASTRQAVLLYVPGIDGGLQRFKSLAYLKQCVQASFKSTEPGALWQCIGRAERNAARDWVRSLAVDEALEVIVEALGADALKIGLQEQIAALVEAHERLGRGERMFTEVSDRSLTTTLLAMEVEQNLQVPANDAREMALNNIQLVIAAARFSATLPPLGTDHRRLLLSQQHSEFNLQRWLTTQLGDVESFGRQRLILQLTRDGFYPGLDIDKPLFDIPDDVSKVWATHPERAVGEAGAKTLVSPERTTYSFLQLALNNLDPQAPWTRWRLQHMTCLDPVWTTRLNVDYLIKTISGLDLGGQFERKILEVCYGEEGMARTAQVSPLLHELLRRPVRHQAKLALLDQQRVLSERGRQLFAKVLANKRGASLAPLQLCFLRLEALTLPWARHIAASVVIHDPGSGYCLLYWPGAIGYPALSEYTSLKALREALMAHLQPGEPISRLAEHVAPGSESQALLGYPGYIKALVEPASIWRRMLERNGMFSVVNIVHSAVETGKYLYRWFKTNRVFPAAALSEIEAEILEQRAHGPHEWLGISATDATDMLGLLAHARVLRVQREAHAQSNSLERLQAYRQWRYGEATGRTNRGLLSMIPLVGVGVVAWEVVLATRRLYHSGSADDVIDLVSSVHLLLLECAMLFLPVKGAKGSSKHLMGPALKRLHQGQRRQASLTVRPPSSSRFKGPSPYKMAGAAVDAVELKAPVDKGTRMRDGEQFTFDATGQRLGVYRRKGEQRLRFKNTQTPGENELFVFIEEPREWLLGADSPQPGTSTDASASWRPTPAPTPVSWSPPSPRLVGDLTRTPINIAGQWREWGQALNIRELTEITPGKNLYQVTGSPRRVVKVGANFYETLADGSQPHADLVFLRPPGGLIDSLEGLTMHLGQAPTQQPLLLTYGVDLRWTPRQDLFFQPLSQSLANRFPGLTPASLRQLMHRMVELADTGTSVTSTRLLNIRAALNRWVPPALGQMAPTDDLLTMLRPVRPRKKAVLYVGLDGEVGGYERADFGLSGAPEARLRGPSRGDVAIMNDRITVSTNAVTRVLQSLGFTVTMESFSSSIRRLVYLVCTHPASNNLYFIWIKWLDGTSLPMKTGRERLMSRAWFTDKHSLRPTVYQRFLTAQNEGRLVKLFAGIQDADPPTIYFLRPADLD
ncbi:dermonecrotic toxin domain-containing protein [Pseudomonas lactucae]|uniref:dermonecrotic toxin domain-containing protein n=1 Tax=Pseudomonas lactucae TaxID=2813360 RepID=UPI002FCD669F